MSEKQTLNGAQEIRAAKLLGGIADAQVVLRNLDQLPHGIDRAERRHEVCGQILDMKDLLENVGKYIPTDAEVH